MSDTLWFTRQADGSLTDEHGNYVIVHPHIPDWVMLPPQLGGHKMRVENASTEPCPMCDSPCPTLTLENAIKVASCDRHDNPHIFYRNAQ